jgi:hypothetical protein
VEIKSMTEPVEPVITSRVSGPNPIRVAIVVAVAIVLVVSAAITLAASPSAPAAPGLGAAPSAAVASPALQHAGQSGVGRPSLGGFGRIGGFGFGFGGFGAFGGGMGIGGATIASIDGSKLNLQTADGWTRTITVTGSTKISRAGQTIKLTDLKQGDTIAFRESKASDGTYQIDSISVILPSVVGQVTKISGDTITIKGFGGATSTIHVSGSTTFRIFGTAKPTIADLKVGMAIGAVGTKNSDGSLNALSVNAGMFKAFGPGGSHKTPAGGAKPGASAAPGA